MQQDIPHAPYTSPIRARWRDRTTGLGFGFLEAPFNKAVAELASQGSEHLRRAFILALFPQLPEKDWPAGRTPHLEESGNGADFIAVDHDPDNGGRTELARTEHKPGKTPPQWNHGVTTDQLQACDAVDVTAEQAAHMRKYAHILDKRWINADEFDEVGGYDCNGLKKRKGVKDQYEPVKPQVIKYLLQPTPMPVVQVIADRSSDINELYEVPDVWYRLKPERFPICTTADVLNRLAQNLDLEQLTPDETSALMRVADALWLTADKAITDQCTPQVRHIVSEAAWHRGYNWDDGDWVRWADDDEVA
ncbi:MAG: hypothetical protein DI630_16545 [Gordonia sp. (in: high G+C Gram-positive bacteria)]|nr:MAG: hypothetical protein DI630_16545 [Gordonia sp. (in: high G+C Gram-positive bacteria)]